MGVSKGDNNIDSQDKSGCQLPFLTCYLYTEVECISTKIAPLNVSIGLTYDYDNIYIENKRFTYETPCPSWVTRWLTLICEHRIYTLIYPKNMCTPTPGVRIGLPLTPCLTYVSPKMATW